MVLTRQIALFFEGGGAILITVTSAYVNNALPDDVTAPKHVGAVLM
jgi:hypothetical protein